MRLRTLSTLSGIVMGCGLAAGFPPEAPEKPGEGARPRPRLERLAVFPAEVSLNSPYATQRLVVEAYFPDGHQEDRTAQAKFSSSVPDVAEVDEFGVVRAVADGDAVITVTAGQHRTAVPVSVPVKVRNMKKAFTWSFRNHVVPVMTKAGCNSGPCHGAAAGKNGFKLTLRGYDPQMDYQVLTRQAVGRRVVKREPARSLILLKPTLAIAHGGGKRFDVDSKSYRIISEWIAAGTPAPSLRVPRLERVEVLPSEVLLRPGAEQQVVVLAHFSDGRVQDVTPWAKFESTEAGVAGVDQTGWVRMQGYGEAAVTVWYMSKVAIARLTVPFPNRVNPDVYRRAARNNYIDELVLEKLERLRIPPSVRSTGSEFLRRVYLDTIGVLPTAAEAEEFLQDPSPDKREKLIDALLTRPEFVDYWAHKWADVLLLRGRSQEDVTGGSLPSNTLRSYYHWLRESVETNKPWDRFVWELLVSSGSNLENGAVNFLVTNSEARNASENVAKAFLGLSLNCAKCHDHPLEKWTQNDYYAMANLFARVGRKDGRRKGEVIVFTKASGEVQHPRLGRPLRPRTLTGAPLEFEAAVDRRRHLAEWLTSEENPLFARTLVNRVWGNFMGRGLVDPVDDMRTTNPAANEKVLAALTKDFVEHGFDVEYLIRLILRSATYQRSSEPNELNADDEKYNSHYLPRRLPAEVILDAVSQVTGVPENFSGYPRGTRALQLPDSKVKSYFLTTFGRNPREVTDESERESSPSVTQVLHITNGETLNRKLRAAGGAVDMLIKLKLSPERTLDHLYLSAFSRYPTEAEREKLVRAMGHADRAGREAGLPAQESRRQALQDLSWAVLTSKEFLFNH